ncbi:hypothetical protein FOL46_009735, partial [Perkinsus olseni]
MKIFTQQTKPWAPWRRIVTPLKVDTQDLYAVIDTGSPYTQLIWKKWYESSPERRCDELFYKCYGCNPSPIADFYFYGVTVEDIVFGVVMDASDGPWAALGLGPQATSPPFPRFVDQLVDAELMMRELIIGGDDPSKHGDPLRYIDIIDKQHHTSKLRIFGFGNEWQEELQPVVFDTGSSFISFPERLRSQVLDLLSTAGTKKVEVTKEGEVYSVDCKDVDYLPTISFILQGIETDVTIAISPEAYLVSPEPEACIIHIHFDEGWILGLPAFVGHYYSFDWAGARIGVAKVKE